MDEQQEEEEEEELFAVDPRLATHIQNMYEEVQGKDIRNVSFISKANQRETRALEAIDKRNQKQEEMILKYKNLIMKSE